MVLQFLILIVAVITFLGSGGLDLISNVGKRAKDEFESNTNITINQSEKDAIKNDEEIPTTPKEKITQDKTNLILDKTTKKTFQEAQKDRKEKESRITKVAPKTTSGTSLIGAAFRTGKQIKRDSSFKGEDITNLSQKLQSGQIKQTSFNKKLLEEQKRAEAIAAALFGAGNFANPEFSRTN